MTSPSRLLLPSFLFFFFFLARSRRLPKGGVATGRLKPHSSYPISFESQGGVGEQTEIEREEEERKEEGEREREKKTGAVPGKRVGGLLA